MHQFTETAATMIEDVGQRENWDTRRPNPNKRANGFYRTLLAMTGHDLRHPLQVIVSVNALLSRSLSGLSECEYLARSRDASLQLIKQLDRLIEALRMHDRAEEISLQPVPLEFLFENIRREHAVAAKIAGLEFRVVQSRAMVMSDPFLLEGIVRNLIYNALKYTPQDGRVLIGCRRGKGGVRIEVHDTGIGISNVDTSKIFDAFQRLDTSGSEGLGLGLFIVRHAADSLGHKVQVQSVPGKGSCFSVIIPSVMPS